MGSKILSKLNFFNQFIYIDTNDPLKVLAVLGNYDVKNIPIDNGDYIVYYIHQMEKKTQNQPKHTMRYTEH